MTIRFATSLTIAFTALVVGAPSASAADDDPVVSGKKMSEWIADLKSGDGKKAFLAADTLGTAKEKAKAAAPALIALLSQKDNYLVYKAKGALEGIGSDALPALLEGSKSKDEKIRTNVTGILRQHHAEASEKAGFGSVKAELAEMKKLKATAGLNGTGWFCASASSANGAMTSSGTRNTGSSEWSIRFLEKEVEFDSLPRFKEEPGKGTYTTDTTKTPNRIELRIGDEVYKGIFEVKKASADSLVTMKLEFAGSGDEYPAKFTEFIKFPKGSKGVGLSFERVK